MNITVLTQMSRFMIKTLLACLALFVLTSAHGEGAEHIDPDQFGQWTMSYYLDPRPDQIAAALEIITAKGYFENDNVQAPLTGFFTAVFQANPDNIADWIKPYIGIADRHILYSALWMANSAHSRAALQTMAQGAAPQQAHRLKRLAATEPPTIASMVIESPASLDYLWGYFFASGQAAPVRRVIEQITVTKKQRTTMTLLIRKAAHWSVASNARQHQAVRKIVKATARTADPATRSLLTAMMTTLNVKTAKQ